MLCPRGQSRQHPLPLSMPAALLEASLPPCPLDAADDPPWELPWADAAFFSSEVSGLVSHLLERSSSFIYSHLLHRAEFTPHVLVEEEDIGGRLRCHRISPFHSWGFSPIFLLQGATWKSQPHICPGPKKPTVSHLFFFQLLRVRLRGRVGGWPSPYHHSSLDNFQSLSVISHSIFWAPEECPIPFTLISNPGLSPRTAGPWSHDLAHRLESQCRRAATLDHFWADGWFHTLQRLLQRVI